MLRLAAVSTVFGALLCVGTAHGGPPAANGLEVAARVAANANNQGSLALVGLRVGGRLVPHLGLGGYVDATPYFSPTTYKCCGSEPVPERPLRFGGYLDVHLLPTRVVDPWFRVALGFVRTARSAADVELALGLDIRHGRFAFGPFLMWIVPMNDALPKKWIGAGGQLSVAF